MSLFDDLPPLPRRKAKAPGAARGRSVPARAQAAESPALDEGAPESVADLTRRIDAALKGLGRVAVVGEVSRPKTINSGHVFFTLKDEGAALDAKIWRSQVQRALGAAGGRLEDGMRVVCHGTLDVYAPYGKHSLIVDRVEARGIGALLADLERLKVRLREEGLFDRKRPLPSAPRRIGVVTSRDADAWRDFLRTRSLRWAGYPVRLCHSRVQGGAAAGEIADAIERLDRSGVDVIVVCRGGGAIEDLWCFNEEAVARAAFAASVPVVSGVGHETDTTLIDLVADHRAHTPTDAAQTVIPERARLLERLERAGAYLAEAMERTLDGRAERLERLAATRSLARPLELVEDRERTLAELARRASAGARAPADGASTRLEQLAARLERGGPAQRVAGQLARAEGLGERLVGAMDRRLGAEASGLADLGRRLEASGREDLQRRTSALEALARTLGSVSPLGVLERGYSITTGPDGAVVTDAAALDEGDQLVTILGRGRVRSTVSDAAGGGGDGPGGEPPTP